MTTTDHDVCLEIARQLDAEPIRERLDADTLAAIDDGELTRGQLRRLIAWEAGQLGLSFDEAVEMAALGTLPRTVLGADVDLLLRMLS